MFASLAFCLACEKRKEQVVARAAPPKASPTPLPSPTQTGSRQAERIDKAWASKFRFSTHSIQKTHAGIRGYEISVDYPQIKGTPSRSALIFNRWIKGKILGDVQRFKRLEQEAEISDRRRKLKPVSITEGLEISFIVYYTDSRLISLRLTHSVMALGQMHPVDYYETLNYDLALRRPLRAHDAFKPGNLKVFSRYSRRYLKANYEMDFSKDDWLREGTAAKSDNFPNWNIVPDGVLISFADYQIAPHAFGQLELIVPYSELRAVVRKRALSRVHRFLRDTLEATSLRRRDMFIAPRLSKTPFSPEERKYCVVSSSIGVNISLLTERRNTVSALVL